jgi:small ligand-binding sensory domain FIST
MVKVGAGLSDEPDALAAGEHAAQAVSASLSGSAPDVALVFVSGAHLAAPEAALEAVQTMLAPRALIGCGAGGVLGERRELESGTAVAVWAAAFDEGGIATPFHVTMDGELESPDEAELMGLPAVDDARGVILLPDPYTFPVDAALHRLTAAAPLVPILGGIASGRTPDGEGALFLGNEVRDEGAVGVALDGVEMLPCVSQGATPVGREVTITAAEGNIIHELAGKPALQTVERIIADLPPRERALVASGLLIGIVIDGGKPEYEQGDFLVRGVLGADPDSGAVAVGAQVREGQVVRLHARDARSADDDLRRALGVRVSALAGRPPAGALVFSCNGRGRSMFGVRDHDASVIADELGGAPTAGFFAAGEIGPVGGRSFLHGFTATVAVFPG